MISDATALKNFLDGLPQYGTVPNLYVDLEGNNLSRNGTLSIITILVEPRHTVHLVDVHVLGKTAFTTSSTKGTTLKQILESNSITKVFFDIRRDSEALYSLFGVRIAGIEDLQLMELGSRGSDKKFVKGLAKCIEQDAPLSLVERREWKAVKERGVALFSPARGGSYAVFDQRPLSPEVEKYCAKDVIYMPALRQKYFGLLSNTWKAKVNTETVARITLSQSATFNTQGNDMAKGPEAWNQPSGERQWQYIDDFDFDGNDDDYYNNDNDDGYYEDDNWDDHGFGSHDA
jgi:exonuclease 3'-5' domain-containing protein 1